MIKFRRGTTDNLRKDQVALADGQPGYDRIKHKIKVGDGKTLWKALPYATGFFDYEILNSEKEAKKRFKADDEDITIMSYGEEDPDSETVGKLYLQHYESEPETDYIVSNGVNGIWTYQKWHSGVAKCWGTFVLTTEVTKEIEELPQIFHSNSSTKSIAYPFTFKEVPSETVSVQGAATLSWLACKSANTKTTTATYSVVSLGKSDSAVKHTISIQVEGFWR